MSPTSPCRMWSMIRDTFSGRRGQASTLAWNHCSCGGNICSVSLDILSKSPPFPGLGKVGIYIDWCISRPFCSLVHRFDQQQASRLICEQDIPNFNLKFCFSLQSLMSKLKILNQMITELFVTRTNYFWMWNTWLTKIKQHENKRNEMTTFNHLKKLGDGEQRPSAPPPAWSLTLRTLAIIDNHKTSLVILSPRYPYSPPAILSWSDFPWYADILCLCPSALRIPT